MYFEREISQKILSLVNQFPAIILTGARQSGKTTLLRHLFPEYGYISLDLPSLAEQADQNPDTFFKSHPPPLLIDEAQYASGLFRNLKVEIDRERSRKGRFIITGSQNFKLMQDVSESLAGRVGLAELDTFSSAEILRADPDVFDAASPSGLLRVLARGTFPELWEKPEMDATEFYRAYVATYLERDIRNLIRVGSLRDFERFLRLLALRSGQLLNKSDLARDVGVSLPTLGEWLSVLETSHQVTLLEPYYGNPGQRLIKTPKVYFHDTGLLCFLAGISPSTLLPGSPLIGPIWETFVFGQISRALSWRTTAAALFFWRDRYGNEVDFVIETGGKLRPVEAKWSQLPSAADLSRLVKLAGLIGKNTLSPWFACPGADPRTSPERVRIINPAPPRAWDEI